MWFRAWCSSCPTKGTSLKKTYLMSSFLIDHPYKRIKVSLGAWDYSISHREHWNMYQWTIECNTENSAIASEIEKFDPRYQVWPSVPIPTKLESQGILIIWDTVCLQIVTEHCKFNQKCLPPELDINYKLNYYCITELLWTLKERLLIGKFSQCFFCGYKCLALVRNISCYTTQNLDSSKIKFCIKYIWGHFNML